jgi:hypothetical protein
MTKVRIELNYGEGLRPPLPIEIRRLDLALVDRNISGWEFELSEGDYFVTSTLPDGRKLFGQGTVTGEETTILLSLDADRDQGESVDLFLPGQDVDATIEVRQFTGNILTGDIVDQSRQFPDPFSFDVEGTSSTPIIQVLKTGFAPLNMLIPVYSSEECKVLIRAKEGPVKVEIRLEDPAADVMLQYLVNGYLREAAILAQSEFLKDLFPAMDHSSQLVQLYTLLRVGELDELTSKIFDTEFVDFSEFTSPDSSAIRGEVLARLGRHQEAFEAFLELEARGVPVFTDGVFYATQRLKIYRSVLEMSSLKNDISSYSILSRLQRIATYQTSDYPIVAYTGYDLMEPDAVSYIRQLLPLSIGIETLGGIFTKIFDRNTPLPASASQIFSTATDNQTSVEVQLFQGERTMTADNRSLGKFVLSGIAPRPRGMPQIEVVFRVDASGVITVSARDLESDRVQETTFNSALPAAEVNRVRQEAESSSESDVQRLKVTETRIRIESLIEQVKQARSNRQMDQIAAMSTEVAIIVAEIAVQTEDADAMERAITALYETLSRLMDQQSGAVESERAEGVSAGMENELDADAEP